MGDQAKNRQERGARGPKEVRGDQIWPVSEFSFPKVEHRFERKLYDEQTLRTREKSLSHNPQFSCAA